MVRLSMILSVRSFSAVFAALCTKERHWARSVHSFRSSMLNFLSENRSSSLKRFLGRPFGLEPSCSSPYRSCFGSRLSDIRVTRPAYFRCFLRISVSMTSFQLVEGLQDSSCHFPRLSS